MITEQQQVEVDQFIVKLTDIIDFYRTNPHVKLPAVSAFTIYGATKDETITGARAFGRSEKEFIGNYFQLTKTFPSGVKLDFFIPRETICEPVVVGKIFVDAYTVPEKLVEAHEEDIVEWRCGSLLAPGNDGAEGTEAAPVAVILDIPTDDIPF